MAQKSVHLLTHFHQEICGTCDQNLICIGENFYVLHGTITCIPRSVKTEPLSCELAVEQKLDEYTEFADGQFVDDLKKEVEDQDFDQQCALSQEGCLDADDFERNDNAPLSKQSVKDYSSDQNDAHEDILGEAQSSNRTTKIQKPKANVQKLYRVLKGKNKRYQCIECEKTYSRTDHLKTHVLSVHRPSDKAFECIECGQKFAAQYRLNDHKKYRAVCNTCGRMFCTKKLQQLHQAEEHDYRETTATSSICHYNGCNELVAECGWAEHMANKHPNINRKEKKPDPYECDICSKTYKTKTGVEFHLLSVHFPSTKKFKCKICGYATVSQKLLEQHQRKIHIEQRNFMCSVCGKTFRLNHQISFIRCKN